MAIGEKKMWMKVGSGSVILGLGLIAIPFAGAQTIPIQATAGGPQIVKAQVDGHSGLFLFDSGFGVTAVTPVTAETIGCKPWGNLVGFRATGERVDSTHCNAGKLTLGSVDLPLPTIAVLDLMRYMPPKTPILLGAIGLNAFAGRTITIRSGAKEIILETQTSLSKRIRAAQAIPIRLVRDSEGVALSVNVGVPTSSGMAWMELDTGNAGPNMISKAIAPLFGLDPKGTVPQNAELQILPGVVAKGQVQVLDLILDGNIGQSFLDQWDVTLDLANSRGWLVAAATSTKR